MKVIFLDIDGVLNYTDWYTSEEYQALKCDENTELDIDPKCAERINNICESTGAKIVITSDWRISWYGTLMRMEKGGIKPEYILDKTPELMWYSIPGYDKSRGSEIKLWLETHKECLNYIIIDDRTDFRKEQKKFFIHVNPKIGFTDTQMNKAINLLNF